MIILLLLLLLLGLTFNNFLLGLFCVCAFNGLLRIVQSQHDLRVDFELLFIALSFEFGISPVATILLIFKRCSSFELQFWSLNNFSFAWGCSFLVAVIVGSPASTSPWLSLWLARPHLLRPSWDQIKTTMLTWRESRVELTLTTPLSYSYKLPAHDIALFTKLANLINRFC